MWENQSPSREMFYKDSICHKCKQKVHISRKCEEKASASKPSTSNKTTDNTEARPKTFQKMRKKNSEVSVKYVDPDFEYENDTESESGNDSWSKFNVKSVNAEYSRNKGACNCE